MPLYAFRCESCGREQEELQEQTDPPPVCCKKSTNKILSKTNFQLKGDGWFKDGYQKK